MLNVAEASSAAMADGGVIGALERNALEAPNECAVILGNETLTWRELNEQASRIAIRLHDAGFKRGDRAAICARNTINYVTTLLGVVKAGLSVVPLPTMASAETLGVMLADSSARALFTDISMRSSCEAAIGETKTISTLIGFDFQNDRWRGLDRWLGEALSDATLPLPKADDEFNIVYSSGTTGTPKGVRHTHAFRAGDASELHALGFRARALTVITTPLYSNWSLYALLAAVQSRGAAAIMAKFDIDAFVDFCERNHPANVFLVPVQCQRLLNSGRLDKAKLGDETLKWVAGSPLHADVKRQIMNAWPGGLNEIYGMTEGAPSATLRAHLFPDKLHSVGRPAEGSSIKIVDDDGAEVKQGEVGEIVGKGPSMMIGYNNNAEADALLLWRDARGEVYFRSGDLGYLDPDGFLYIAGRKKDMIISGGFNIYPADLEAALLQHPEIAETAVIAALSRKWGETPIAIAVLRNGARIAPDALRHFANERLGKVQKIARVIIVDELPRGNLGKILKTTLREKYGAILVD